MIERVLGIFLPVLLVVVVGYLYARRVKPDMAAVNRISMTILAPALIFSALASKDFDVGAYGAVLGSTYLRRPLPPEALVDGGTFTTIRRRQTLDELLQLEV